MNMNTSNFTVNLNRETYDLLSSVQDDLSSKLGFVPTMGQTVRHLIAVYHGNTSGGNATVI